MNDKELLLELLASEHEEDAIAALAKRGLLDAANANRWVALGNMPNNQSVVHAQQSTATAALVEKFTNGLDAILIRRGSAISAGRRSKRSPCGPVGGSELFRRPGPCPAEFPTSPSHSGNSFLAQNPI